MTQPVNESQPSEELRRVRHDIRGLMNSIVLCASALDESLDLHESIEFLNHIENATDKLVVMLDKLESLTV